MSNLYKNKKRKLRMCKACKHQNAKNLQLLLNEKLKDETLAKGAVLHDVDTYMRYIRFTTCSHKLEKKLQRLLTTTTRDKRDLEDSVLDSSPITHCAQPYDKDIEDEVELLVPSTPPNKLVEAELSTEDKTILDVVDDEVANVKPEPSFDTAVKRARQNWPARIDQVSID